MTVYVGGIQAGVAFLKTLIAANPDLSAAPARIRADALVAASALVEAIDAAVAQLDAQIAAAGLDRVTSGTFPLDSIKLLGALQANLIQQRTLVDMRGFAGRVLLNCKMAG